MGDDTHFDTLLRRIDPRDPTGVQSLDSRASTTARMQERPGIQRVQRACSSRIKQDVTCKERIKLPVLHVDFHRLSLFAEEKATRRQHKKRQR